MQTNLNLGVSNGISFTQKNYSKIRRKQNFITNIILAIFSLTSKIAIIHIKNSYKFKNRGG